MVKPAYIPDRGDVVWTDFNPQAGREQAGKRPALVLSPKAYNSKTGLAVMVPITSQIKGYPFEVAIQTKSIKGVALSDHLKNLDWKTRGVALAGTVPSSVVRRRSSDREYRGTVADLIQAGGRLLNGNQGFSLG